MNVKSFNSDRSAGSEYGDGYDRQGPEYSASASNNSEDNKSPNERANRDDEDDSWRLQSAELTLRARRADDDASARDPPRPRDLAARRPPCGASHPLPEGRAAASFCAATVVAAVAWPLWRRKGARRQPMEPSVGARSTDAHSGRRERARRRASDAPDRRASAAAGVAAAVVAAVSSSLPSLIESAHKPPSLKQSASPTARLQYE